MVLRFLLVDLDLREVFTDVLALDHLNILAIRWNLAFDWFISHSIPCNLDAFYFMIIGVPSYLLLKLFEIGRVHLTVQIHGDPDLLSWLRLLCVSLLVSHHAVDIVWGLISGLLLSSLQVADHLLQNCFYLFWLVILCWYRRRFLGDKIMNVLLKVLCLLLLFTNDGLGFKYLCDWRKLFVHYLMLLLLSYWPLKIILNFLIIIEY